MPADRSDYVKTNELRFVERLAPGSTPGSVTNRVIRILQQLCVHPGVIRGYEFHDGNSEWRDVPLGAEAKPENKIPDHVIEEINRDAAMDETITLSAAATKAWNEPYRDGEGRSIEQRRQQRLPDYEKPPLGPAPAWASPSTESNEGWLQRSMISTLEQQLEATRGRLEASVKANEAMLDKIQTQKKALEWIVENKGSHVETTHRVALDGLGRKE